MFSQAVMNELKVSKEKIKVMEITTKEKEDHIVELQKRLELMTQE